MTADLWGSERDDYPDDARRKERSVRDRKVCSKCGAETGYDWPSELCNPCWQAEALAKVPDEDSGYDDKTRGFHSRDEANENKRLRRE